MNNECTCSDPLISYDKLRSGIYVKLYEYNGAKHKLIVITYGESSKSDIITANPLVLYEIQE